jgi:hypothetical protein
MKKRIKLLAEQAGFHFYDMHNVDGQDLGESIEADEWSAAEKFAELIVRECVGILETEIADVLAPKTIFNQDEWDKNNMCFTLLVNMITLTKEHFGVEE